MASNDPLSEKKRFAVLIDGDNAQPSLIQEVLAEVSQYGRTTFRRIYGDWTTPNMNAWKETLQENAIQPVQQFRHAKGKNSTDSAMIIDAMDILHSGAVDGFCLVSSDSDYTRLATRIREQGLFVLGIGNTETVVAFTMACDKFVFNKSIPKKEQTNAESKTVTVTATAVPAKNALPLLRKAFESCVRDRGWAHLGEMGNRLKKLDRNFGYRAFGCSSLRALVTKLPDEIELQKKVGTNGNTAELIRFK